MTATRLDGSTHSYAKEGATTGRLAVDKVLSRRRQACANWYRPLYEGMRGKTKAFSSDVVDHFYSSVNSGKFSSRESGANPEALAMMRAAMQDALVP